MTAYSPQTKTVKVRQNDKVNETESVCRRPGGLPVMKMVCNFYSMLTKKIPQDAKWICVTLDTREMSAFLGFRRGPTTATTTTTQCEQG
jgi:hypothetical protein